MTGMQCYVMLSTMSVRPDMATVKPRLPRNSLWLIFVSLGTILSGCSLDPLAQRPEAASPQPAPSAELLRQAEAHGFAEGFKAGRRFQEARDHDLASGTPAAPTPLLPVTTGEARICRGANPQHPAHHYRAGRNAPSGTSIRTRNGTRHTRAAGTGGQAAAGLHTGPAARQHLRAERHRLAPQRGAGSVLGKKAVFFL